MLRHFHRTQIFSLYLTPHFASSNEIIDRYKNKSLFLVLWDKESRVSVAVVVDVTGKKEMKIIFSDGGTIR